MNQFDWKLHSAYSNLQTANGFINQAMLIQLRCRLRVVNNPSLQSVWSLVDEFDQTQTLSYDQSENNLFESLFRIRWSLPRKRFNVVERKLKAMRKVLSNWNWPMDTKLWTETYLKLLLCSQSFRSTQQTLFFSVSILTPNISLHLVFVHDNWKSFKTESSEFHLADFISST